MAIGIVDTGQVILSADPTENNHAVPLWYLRRAWGGGLEGIDIGANTLFPSVRNDVERKSVFVDEQGFLSAAKLTESGGAERTLGYVKGGKLYLNNMFVRGLTGLQVGKAYWIQTDGGIGASPVSQEGLWSVRLGVAISPSDLQVNIHISGGI